MDCFSLFQEQNKEVACKLGIATGLMFTLPIISFFVAMHIFANKEDPTMWAGGVAIILTNLIIAGYVYSAFSEPDDELVCPGDADGPRVGAFKQRTD